MTFLIVAFIAGLLTVLAPYILPVLPVVIGSSATTRSKIIQNEAPGQHILEIRVQGPKARFFALTFG